MLRGKPPAARQPQCRSSMGHSVTHTRCCWRRWARTVCSPWRCRPSAPGSTAQRRRRRTRTRCTSCGASRPTTPPRSRRCPPRDLARTLQRHGHQKKNKKNKKNQHKRSHLGRRGRRFDRKFRGNAERTRRSTSWMSSSRDVDDVRLEQHRLRRSILPVWPIHGIDSRLFDPTTIFLVRT